MRKRLLWFIASIVVVITAALLFTWLAVRASLPLVDGEIVLAGLTETATIARDDAGIPTITAGSRGDLAFATGFAHGQDRFFQMDLIRRQAAGELAEIFGEPAIAVDKRYRFHRFRALAHRVMAAATEDEQHVVERYAAGVNAGLNSLDARPFEYLLLGQQPEPWLAEDTVLTVYAMFMQLNDARARKDVRRGLAQRVLPESVFAWLYPVGTTWDAPLMGAARPLLPYPSRDIYSVREWDDDALPAQERGGGPFDGSNNWAVSGKLTESGRALVSNDMHLGLSVPNIYYQARLVQVGAESRDVTGLTLPGTPFVIAGSNGFVAWGYTNSYGDWSDAVVLQPGKRADSYQTPDGDREFVVHHETIDVDGSKSVRYDIRETIWGPVDDGVDYPDGEIAVSWIAHMPEAVNLKILQLETATSAVAALDIANTIGMPPQNFVTGDASGNIGWTVSGKIPVKQGFDALVPADWSEQHGWHGWRGEDEYPRVFNPESGRIWSANARVADADALAVIGDGGYDLGARAQQIRDALFAREIFAPADMLAIQYDDRAIFLQRWRDLLLRVLDESTVAGDPKLMEYRKLVETWIPRALPESVGYRLVRGFRLAVRGRVFHGLMAPVREHYEASVDTLISNQFEAPLWQLVNEQPEHLLPGGYANWNQLMVDAVRENIGWLEENYAGPLAERSWGERNTANIAHPLSSAVPLLGPWLDMPYVALSGDANLPKAQGPAFGASERFSVSPGDEANGLMHMPTGQSGHPLSDFYREGHADWVAGRASPFLPGAAAYTLTLMPAGGNMGTTAQ